MSVLLLCAATAGLGDPQQMGAGRTWTSITGSSVEAEYIGLEHGRVKLRTRDGTLTAIAEDALSAEDRAWIKEEEARLNAPAEDIRPARISEELPVFKTGDWVGYHTVYTAPNFDACLDAEGVMWIYPKEHRSRIGKPMRLPGLFRTQRG